MKSDAVKKGPTRCAHRSLFYALGFGPEDLEKPLIGICNSFNEVIPGHMHLREITEAAKLGVAAAGGTPMEFPAIGVCDGIAMGADCRLHRSGGNCKRIRRPRSDSKLRQSRAGHADGRGPAQYPVRSRQRRRHAGRTVSRTRRQRQPVL